MSYWQLSEQFCLVWIKDWRQTGYGPNCQECPLWSGAWIEKLQETQIIWKDIIVVIIIIIIIIIVVVVVVVVVV